MKKSFSNIILGVSLVGCLGIFLPASLSAGNPCDNKMMDECNKKAACKWYSAGTPGFCTGRGCDGIKTEKVCANKPKCHWQSKGIDSMCVMK